MAENTILDPRIAEVMASVTSVLTQAEIMFGRLRDLYTELAFAGADRRIDAAVARRFAGDCENARREAHTALTVLAMYMGADRGSDVAPSRVM
jgi:hypothetical protein